MTTILVETCSRVILISRNQYIVVFVVSVYSVIEFHSSGTGRCVAGELFFAVSKEESFSSSSFQDP